MPLFGISQKSPRELVSTLISDFRILDSSGIPDERRDETLDDLSNVLSQIKYHLDPVEGDGTELEAQISQEFYDSKVFIPLINHLGKLDSQAQNDVVQIWSTLLRRQVGARAPTVDYFVNQNKMLLVLLQKYESPNFLFNYGVLLRECMRYEPLMKLLVRNPAFFDFFTYIEMPRTDVAADAFATFKDILRRHKAEAAIFLEENYDRFTENLNKFLNSDSDETKEMTLNLLGELLVDRHNFVFMERYIGNPENLEIFMKMLRDERSGNQLGAFQVFKVFVANPEKTPPVLDMLLKNKDDLVEYLTGFLSDNTEEQFNDEKNYLIQQLKVLQPSMPTAST